MDLLKQMFGNKLDEEMSINPGDKVDETSTDEQPADNIDSGNSKLETEAGVEKDETSKDDGDQVNKNTDNNDVGGENMPIFEDGWFNSESGLVDESKIKNPEALEAIKMLTGMYQAERNQRAIYDSVTDVLKDYSLSVSDGTIRKILDLSNVTFDKDGKVIGVKEAVENLKTAEPGFFKDKDKDNSSPILEGFNPVEKSTTITEDDLINMAYGTEN